MGKSYSKEEVVIAQNSAATSQITKYETGFAIVATAVLLIFMLVIWRQGRHRMKKWIHRQVNSVSGGVTTSPGRIDTLTVPQQPPTASYA